MREPKETLEAGASVDLTRITESELQAWNTPTLTTFKIEEETLDTATVSGA